MNDLMTKLAEEYEEGIRSAIRYGLEGEAIMGIDSLCEKFPVLYDEVLDEKKAETLQGVFQR